MSVTKVWEMLPNADFADRTNWQLLGNDRYAALRGRLLIVQSNGQKSRRGPVIEEYSVAPGDTIGLRRRRERVISHTTTISNAIIFAATSRVCDQLTAKVGAELAAKVPGFSGKLSSEILSKSDYEITATAEDVLSTTTSHVIQETQEDEHVITLEGTNSHRVAELRRVYWPRRWDFYFHSYEYLELSYKRPWFSRETRQIKKADSGVLGWPLVSVVFYEPQSGFDVCYGPVADELTNPDSIEILTLTEPMPRSIAPETEELEDLAELAFPVTKEEKSKALGRVKKAPAKKVARKVAAKRPYGRQPPGRWLPRRRLHRKRWPQEKWPPRRGGPQRNKLLCKCCQWRRSAAMRSMVGLRDCQRQSLRV